MRTCLYQPCALSLFCLSREAVHFSAMTCGVCGDTEVTVISIQERFLKDKVVYGKGERIPATFSFPGRCFKIMVSRYICEKCSHAIELPKEVRKTTYTLKTSGNSG